MQKSLGQDFDNVADALQQKVADNDTLSVGGVDAAETLLELSPKKKRQATLKQNAEAAAAAAAAATAAKTAAAAAAAEKAK